MNTNVCAYCSGTLEPDDVAVSSHLGSVHVECAVREDYDEDCDVVDTATQDNRVLARLKRTIKPKLYQAVMLLKQDSFISNLKVVAAADVQGQRQKASSWFGRSVAIRHVYDHTQYDSYAGSYSGVVYLPLGNRRYLQLSVWG